MAIDTANLLSAVYSLFASIYAAQSNDQAFLAFETFGIPISEGMFKLNPTDTALSPPLGIQGLSDIANPAVQIRKGSIVRGLATVDGTVSFLLQASMPVNSDAMVAVGGAKQDASTNFDITLAYLDGVPNHRFHPVYATPKDWYDPTSSTNWTLQHVGEEATPPVQPPAPINSPFWHVLPMEMRASLRDVVTLNHPLLTLAQQSTAVRLTATAPAAPPAVRPMQATLNPTVTRVFAPFSTVAARVSPGPASAPATAPEVSPALSEVQVLRPQMLTSVVATVHASTTPQPVAANTLDVSFEHCIVLLQRPWLPETFFMLRNWYVPGYAQGSIANGTGAQDPGCMPVLTTGFVAIRNLQITSNWSQQDADAAQASASFGPFSLIGRTYDSGTGTLACPGIQIVGWFCAALPVLPPASDPTISVSAASPSGTAGAGGSPAT